MPGHPDYDAGVVWQAPSLFAQFSGPIPAAGTVLYQGPITGYPSIQLRGSCSAGGYRLRVEYFDDSAMTQSISSQVFDVLTGTTLSGVYEVLGPFVSIRIDAVTVSPAAAGLIAVIPSRAPALSFRPNCFPQALTLVNQSVPANTTSVFQLPFVVIGLAHLFVPTITPAGALTFSLNFVRWDGSTAAFALAGAVLTAPFNLDFYCMVPPLQIVVQNTTANPATFTASLLTQEQGW